MALNVQDLLDYAQINANKFRKNITRFNIVEFIKQKIMGEIAKLELNGVVYEFPVIEGSENEKAIDISSLRGKTGYITIDPGFKNTGSCESAITFLDGELGILRYRGYPIEQLAEKASFIEEYLIVCLGLCKVFNRGLKRGNRFKL